jgi:hypothetical protein
MGPEETDWDRLIGTAPSMIHNKNKPPGKRPTEEGFIEVPLDWLTKKSVLFWVYIRWGKSMAQYNPYN